MCVCIYIYIYIYIYTIARPAAIHPHARVARGARNQSEADSQQTYMHTSNTTYVQ